MSNPYEAPQQVDPTERSRKRLVYGLIFGVLVLATVIGIQWYRFQLMREQVLRAMQRAQAAEMEALEAERRARESSAQSMQAEATENEQPDN